MIDYAASIRPSARQLAWHELEFYAFIHFGMNTFTNREWGDGRESPALFQPSAFDARQWARAVRSAGMRGIILTAKHHDGFCLWPSAYTEHSVKHSPWKRDAVREVADACRAEGLRFGVYLSPWDRHEPSYGRGHEYDDYFVHQLTELATGYGELFAFWFDGACGEGTNGKRQIYDWERYFAVIRRLQPGAVISVCGPDVRWCGNEAGHCRESEWSVVPSELRNAERTQSLSQQADDPAFARRIDSTQDDLGSRAAIANARELVWYPAEVNTSIRPGWFYHPEQDESVRTADELFGIYLNSVGANAAFLLNIPPDARGRIADPDLKALSELGARIHSELERPPRFRLSSVPAPGEIAIPLQEEVFVDYVIFKEDIARGQRIERGEIALDGEVKCAFTVIGHKRICPFHAPARREIAIRIPESRAETEISIEVIARDPALFS